MTAWLYDLPLVGLYLVILVPCVGFAVLAVLLARRLGWVIPEEDTGTASVMHGFVSMVYAVALGLMVVSVQDEFGEVEQASMTEAGEVGDVYRTLAGMSAGARELFQRQTLEYVDLVIDREWPASARGERSDETWAALDRLSYDVAAYRPVDDHEAMIYGQLVADLTSLLDARRLRLHLGQAGVGPVTWLVIVAGSIITVGFIATFPVTRLSRQLLLTSVMATMFGLMIFLIVAMDHPLRGRLAVGPDAFVEVRENMVRLGREHLTGAAASLEAAAVQP
jgi:hypothetical protein